MFPKSILIWKGFEFVLDTATYIFDSADTCSLILNKIQEELRLRDISHAIYQVIFHSSVHQKAFLDYIKESSPDTTLIGITEACETYIVEISVTNTNAQFTPLFRECSYFRTTISRTSDSTESQLIVYTRENNESAKVDIKGLTSHKLYGIDNTGNVCVWAAESMLLYTLLHDPALDSMLRGKQVLELGGGMTALCGLSLAALSLARSVVLTDGHPDCVRNQRFCIQLNQYMNSRQLCGNGGGVLNDTRKQDITSHHISTEVSSEQLRWTVGDTYGEIAACSHNGTRTFDLILGSDILFFVDFHDGLLEALLACLAPSGTVLLLQPPRGGSMQRFVDKARSTGKFNVTISERYNDKVSDIIDSHGFCLYFIIK